MKLETERQVRATRRKLALLERHFEELQNKPVQNEYVREVTLRSLKQFINQLKEEIALFDCHAIAGARNG